ncbi:DUF6492 family protein [Candidatus Protochlamydia phocaeensis]|uniref:DUF6492 family protein n=1 Tax=Candidatus Protochlamydia phocaeensis TaxID=1414722 RepID=UPI000839AC5E|nr:DUF6492 family protein [Candidatus Protochlamydia phocaeensis]
MRAWISFLFCLYSSLIMSLSFGLDAQAAEIDLLTTAELNHSSFLSGPYQFNLEPIDVIIPSTNKDLLTLDLCINGIRANCSQVRRIIVVSAEPLTNQAEWFDERLFPFNKANLALRLLKGNEAMAQAYLNTPENRLGWYYQQLLKLYASFVIPGLSSNVLILDSDTIFLNPVAFTNAQGAGLFNPGTEYHFPYFEHGDRLIPGFQKQFPFYSGISHHMLFQRPILQDLFAVVESVHQKEFWKAFCDCVDLNYLFFGAAEYELYFNFAFARTQQVEIRFLKWDNVNSIDHLAAYQAAGYHYVSCHSWMR